MFRSINPASFEKPSQTPNPGHVPDLRWLAIADLVVDPEYQREIGRRGRANVQSIANTFDWCKFAPVIVATMEGGKYAVVDGQHRTTAAALLGISTVPCQVIIADRAKQAQAFAAVNGAVTKTTPQQLFHARVAAADPAALEILEVCRIAQVTIVQKYKPHSEKPGETQAVAAITRCLSRYGRDTLITALQCITTTEGGNAGWLRATIIEALCIVLTKRHDWREAGSNLLQAMDKFDYAVAWERAMEGRTSILSPAVQASLVDRIMKYLDRRLRTSVETAAALKAPSKPASKRTAIAA